MSSTVRLVVVSFLEIKYVKGPDRDISQRDELLIWRDLGDH